MGIILDDDYISFINTESVMRESAIVTLFGYSFLQVSTTFAIFLRPHVCDLRSRGLVILQIPISTFLKLRE